MNDYKDYYSWGGWDTSSGTYQTTYKIVTYDSDYVKKLEDILHKSKQTILDMENKLRAKELIILNLKREIDFLKNRLSEITEKMNESLKELDPLGEEDWGEIDNYPD